jgi:hypothetical protein
MLSARRHCFCLAIQTDVKSFEADRKNRVTVLSLLHANFATPAERVLNLTSCRSMRQQHRHSDSSARRRSRLLRVTSLLLNRLLLGFPKTKYQKISPEPQENAEPARNRCSLGAAYRTTLRRLNESLFRNLAAAVSASGGCSRM